MFSQKNFQMSWSAKINGLLLVCCLSGSALAGTASYT
jgi:hypothetical protein